MQSIDSSLRGAQALKKKGRKGKWSAHVVRNGCAKKEGNEPFPLRREFFVVVVFLFWHFIGARMKSWYNLQEDVSLMK